MNYTIIKKHISEIGNGDAIMHNEKIMTVCNKDIKRGFHGITIFGDSYRSGTMPVLFVNIITPRKQRGL